jgi:hypothetical protein
MKALLWKGMLTAAITLWALTGSARAQDHDGCTNATLNGDYGSTISGQIFIPNGPTIQREAFRRYGSPIAGGLCSIEP